MQWQRCRNQISAATHALSSGNLTMLPEPSSCTPRSLDVSADAASSSEPARPGPSSWDAMMPKEFKQFLYRWSRWVVLMSNKFVTKKDQPWVVAESQEMKRAMLIKWHTGSNE
eukprot:12927768-Prorocentrum_lima.AAC.1